MALSRPFKEDRLALSLSAPLSQISVFSSSHNFAALLIFRGLLCILNHNPQGVKDLETDKYLSVWRGIRMESYMHIFYTWLSIPV